MKEKKEFIGTKIPENNPNKTNDIYKKNGSQHAVKQLICLLAASIVATIICVVFWTRSLVPILNSEGTSDDYWAIVMIAVLVIACVIWMIVNGKEIYQIYGYRKRIIAGGKMYPAVVGEVKAHTREGSAGHLYGAVKWDMFSMEIKYAEGNFWVFGLEADPRICLENPYCSVYVKDGKAIATDFGLKEAFVSKNGKAYTKGNA